jgi:hypothetical protein
MKRTAAVPLCTIHHDHTVYQKHRRMTMKENKNDYRIIQGLQAQSLTLLNLKQLMAIINSIQLEEKNCANSACGSSNGI